MKFSRVVAFLAATVSAFGQMTPVSKVLALLSDLQSKISADGEAQFKTYQEFQSWCHGQSQNLAFAIKTGQKNAEGLQALIESQAAMASALSTKVDELGRSVADADAELKSASEVRGTEAADFAQEEKQLAEIVETIQRAISILNREMRKGSSFFAELTSAGTVAKALAIMVDASALSTADVGRLTSLVQSSQGTDDDAEDMELGAPAAPVYVSHSRTILDTLQSLLDKAQDQLVDAQKKEASARHNFELLEQSLKDQIKFSSKDMSDAKKDLEAAGEKKAGAEGDLHLTKRTLEEDTKASEDLSRNCMTRAEDFEAAKRSRAEELDALAAAKQAIVDATSSAASATYGLNQISFLQIQREALASRVDLVNFEAVRFVRDLARKQNSATLAQLAAHMASAMHSQGSDPFQKVRGLISELLDKLQADSSADSSHKAYCDKELAESEAKHGELDAAIEKVSSKIDQMTSRSAQLKEETAALQKALVDLASSQAEMDKMRGIEHDAFVKSKKDMEEGIAGVKTALTILRDYYSKNDKAHQAAVGSATSIVGLLEVVESDFSKGLVEMMTLEDSAAASYKKQTQENEIEIATQQQDVSYKSKELAELDKTIAEVTSDRSNTHAEADAVNEYLEKLKKICVEAPETYSERSARRTAEIEGLKQALRILDESTTALLQRKSLRSVSTHFA